MSAFMAMTIGGEPDVTFYRYVGDSQEPVLVVRFGGASIHLDPPAAARLAADILAVLPAEPGPEISDKAAEAIADFMLADAELRGHVAPGGGAR